MPRLRGKAKKAEPETYRYAEAVCVESFRPVLGEPVSRGEIRALGHPLPRRFPGYFRALGPKLDELEEVTEDGKRGSRPAA
jgi:hypothetical protein